MASFVAEIPIPSMGATVHELTLIDVVVQPGDTVTQGQKCAEFESDKSAFDFEAPCDGVVRKILAKAGDIVDANAPFIWIETEDSSQKHLAVDAEAVSAEAASAPAVKQPASAAVAKPAKSAAIGGLKWTPKAVKIARAAGADPEAITDITGTGPGGRVSGDDIEQYLAKQPAAKPEPVEVKVASGAEGTVSIAGIGFAVPRNVRTNKEILSAFPEKTEEDILRITGISQRYVADPEETATSLAAEAVSHALKMAGMDVSEVDGVIMATIIPDQPTPSAASSLARHLGCPGALAFDLNAACSGWLYALEVGRSLILGGTAKTVLVVTAELLSRITNFKDFSTAFLFGDGAGAAVLTNAVAGGHQLHRMNLCGDADQYDAIQRAGGGARMPIAQNDGDISQFYLSMNGPVVFKSAVVAFADMINEVLEREGLTVDEVDWIVPHQANERILRAVSKRVGIPYDRFVVTIGKYGNTSAASVSMALGWAAEEGIFESGDKIIFCSVGAGLTFAGGMLEW